ncbi:hypothetical protein [Micromonospora cathayae]|uniref:DUF1622 domain-containing protein n=1 Tax=Micromonospora cathayae TaxID=3028804 RepID=A0ABY7ZJK3_9ACTN|nr:hypothetical protein [Micromonospora sp. HUAS 3]WDZ83068.1 hypothetical protein PVK37_21690 [Micromonospora sp. HUAS 3]
MTTIVALLGAMALGCAAVVLVTARSWRAALRILLDLLTAVGLFRLTGAQDWGDLAGAAAIVGLRRVLWAVLRPAVPAVRAGDDPRRAAAETITPYRG